MPEDIFVQQSGLTVIGGVEVIAMGPPGTGGGGSGGTPAAHAASHAGNGTDPIANATTSVSGLMSATDKTKLNGVATGATANSTDAQLRDRATHTGTQTTASLSDFAEAVQDVVAGLLGAGSNVTLTYNDASNTLTVSAAATGSTADPEAIRDAIGVALVGVSPINISVNDTADTITISTTATQNSTDAQLRDRASHTGTQIASTISDFTEAAQDATAAMLTGGTHTGATVTYNDASNTLNIAVTGGGSGVASTGGTATDLTLAGITALNSTPLYLRARTDNNHLLAWKATWGGVTVDGPMFIGYAGGALGTTNAGTGEDVTLQWDSNGVNVFGELSVNGTAVSLTGHTHGNATTSAPGFMSAADKAKLDGLSSGGGGSGTGNTPNGTTAAAIKAALAVGDTTLAKDGAYVLETYVDIPAGRTLDWNGATVTLANDWEWTDFGKRTIGSANDVPIGYVFLLNAGSRIVNAGTLNVTWNGTMPARSGATGGFLYAGVLAFNVDNPFVGGLAGDPFVVRGASLYGIHYHLTAGGIIQYARAQDIRRAVGMGFGGGGSTFDTGFQSGGLCLSSSRGAVRKNIIRYCEVDGVDEIGIDNRNGGAFNEVYGCIIKNVGRGADAATRLAAPYNVLLTDGIEPIGLQSYNGGHYALFDTIHVSGMRENSRSGSSGCWPHSIDVCNSPRVNRLTAEIDVAPCRMGVEFAQVVNCAPKDCVVEVKGSGSITEAAFVNDKSSWIVWTDCHAINSRTSQASTTDANGIVTRYADFGQMVNGFKLKGVGTKGTDPRQVGDGDRATKLGSFDNTLNGCSSIGSQFGIMHDSSTANGFVDRTTIRDFRAVCNFAAVEFHGGEVDIDGVSAVIERADNRDDVGVIKLQASNAAYPLRARARRIFGRFPLAGRNALVAISVTNTDPAVIPRPSVDVDDLTLEGTNANHFIFMSQGVGWPGSRIGYNITKRGTYGASDYIYFGGATTASSTPMDRYKSGAFGAPNMIPGGFQWRTAAGVSMVKMGTVAPTSETDGTAG